MPYGNDIFMVDIICNDPDLMPQRSHDSDAGADLRAEHAFTLKPGERMTIPTGVSIGLPHGSYAKLESRSGLASKHGIITLGGIIDSGYQGVIKAILLNTGSEPVQFSKGDRITQLLVHSVHLPIFREVAHLDDSDRGEGGFGSTQLS